MNMNGKNSSLIGLLNLNGSLYRGVAFHEPYRFHRLRTKSPKETSRGVSAFGEILAEKLMRVKMIHGALRNCFDRIQGSFYKSSR